MFWPFKRKKKPPDMWDRAAERMIAQGMDPKEVRHARVMAQRFAKLGALPEGAVEEPDDPAEPGQMGL